MNILIIIGLVISLGLVSPSVCDEVEDVLDCAPKVVLDAGAMERDFLSLESALKAKVDAAEISNDFESLMKAAKELGSQREPLGAGADKKNNRRLKKAINKFSKLEESLDKCDFGGYYNLASNYKTALSCPLLQSAIREAISRHGKNCRRTYLAQLGRKVNKVNKNLLAKIDRLFDRQVLERVFGSDTRSMNNVLKNNLWRPIRQIDDLLLVRIAGLVEHSRQGKYLRKPDERSELSMVQAKAAVDFRTKIYQRQLIKPCKRFVREFAEIFYPAKLDLAAVEATTDNNRTATGKLAEMNPTNDQKFTDIWLKFRLCQAIREDSLAVLKGISAEAEQKLGLSQ